MAFKRVTFEIEIDADTNIEAARSVQEMIQEDSCQKWQFYVQDVETKEVVSVDLDAHESIMETEVVYKPLIQ